MRFKLTALLLALSLGFSQANELPPLSFRGGQVKTQITTKAQLQNHWQALPAFEGRKYFLLRFENFLSQSQFDALRESGLVLEAYIPEKAYFASAPASWSVQMLADKGIVSLQAIPNTAKFDEALLKADEFRPLEKRGRQVLVSVLPFNGIPLEKLNLSLWQNIRFEPAKNRYSDHLVSAWVDERDLQKLASHPAVQFIEPAAPLGEPEDREGRSLHRSHTIDNLMSGGRRYSGQGIVMGIADDGAIGPHIDFKGRLIQYTNNFAAGNTHGDMVAGIAVGAANLNPNMMGMAPGTFLHMYSISSYPHVVPAVANYQNLGTTITSTSYSQGNGGIYTADAATIDDQIRNNTMLMHVFSAGNAGTSDHGYGAGSGWGNITGGYKAAKNVMAVANLRNTDQLENSSSRGPARDGRIKPDIAANGYNQMSTGPNNTYLVGGGTSAASPGIAGIFAQLSHAYRSLNNDSVPPSALLKAVMLNTAEDLGNPGPDFRFGWGRVNALRAVQTLEQNRYFTGVISQGDSLTHTIDVPANAKELRVMVYWADKAGAANATRALVNNLNMRLSGPGDTAFLPWVLNPTPTVAALNSPAVRGIDSLNNVEQVTVSNPAAGNYAIQVLGTAIPVGPQRYWVVYEWYLDEIVVTYPMGGEGFVPGETELIRWDATRISGPFTVQYSLDNGTNWTNIATNLPSTARHVSWSVPAGISGQARIRVSNGTITGQSEQTFSIAPLVSNVAFSFICLNELSLSWNPVTGATGYIVYRLGQRYMDSIGTTTSTNFVVTGTAITDTDYFAVAPMGNNNLRGRRTNAIMKPRNTVFGCQEPPLAGFEASSVNACVDQTITLIDQSLNLATNWRWSITPSTFIFVNGTNDTSQAPQLQFQSTGSYTVQLIASNTFGSDTLVRTNHVVVGNGLSLPQTQNFPGNTLPANWNLENPDNDLTWQFRTGIGPNGSTGMAWMNFFSYNTTGQLDELISPVIDLTTGVSTPLLTFSVAYAQYSSTLFDGMRIEISDDCGGTYQPSSYFKQGTQLATAGTITTSFTPNSANQWRTDSLDLTPFVGSRIRIKFVAINGYGNNLYLTNFRVNSGTGIVAGFNIGGSACLGGTITFESTSTGNITSQSWNFGAGATPATATGAGPHSVQYSSAGNRNVVLTVNGPNGTQQATLPAIVAAEAMSDFNFSAQGTVVSFTNQSQNGTSYRWEFGDGNTSSQPNPTHTYAASNAYEVKLITTNACNSDTVIKTVQAFATAVKSIGGMEAKLYPNPATHRTQIELAGLHGGQPLYLSLHDMQGRVLWKEQIAVADELLLQSIELNGIAAGLYQLRLVQGDRAMQLPLVKSE